jgi:predicted ATP-grasp superfamily ATP-dependent carboligase
MLRGSVKEGMVGLIIPIILTFQIYIINMNKRITIDQ